MKKNNQFMMLGLLLVNGVTHALNPIQGWYGGVRAGVSYQPDLKVSYTYKELSSQLSIKNETLSYSVLGGVGGQVGYRINDFRFELEGSYNTNPYKTLTIELTDGTSYGITSSTSTTGFSIKGNNDTYNLMLNAYYDIFNLFSSESEMAAAFVPYVGLGIGGSYNVNGIALNYDQSQLDYIKYSNKGAAAQALIGLNYFLDDFSTVGINAQYFSNLYKNTYTNTRGQIASVNLTFNGAFYGD